MIWICANAFKGTLTSRAVCRALARGIRAARPDLGLAERPLADGGDGTAAVLARALGGRRQVAQVHGPLGAPLRAHAYLLRREEAWALDLAGACGLRRLGGAPPDPLAASTRGLGELMAAVWAARPDRPLWVGLGGSASTDGGSGALAALGFGLLDRRGRPVPPGAQGLLRLERLVPPARPLPRGPVVLLTDVTSPLLGPDGAAVRFGPQKGASPAQVPLLEEALDRWRHVAERDLGAPPDLALRPGAGAAGGAGYGLAAALNAQLVDGAEWVLRYLDADRWREPGAVWISGEGRLDRTTLLGKAPGALLRRASGPGAPRLWLVCAAAEPGMEAALAGRAGVLTLPPRPGGRPAHGGDLARAAAGWAREGRFDP